MELQSIATSASRPEPSQTVDRTASGATQPVQPAVPQLTNDDVQKSMADLKIQLGFMKETNVQMQYDEDIDRVIVKFVTPGTEEVVSQIPTERFVEFQRAFVKTIGLLFDRKV